jgi:alkyl sulfatase BDS1-like metallo-beta-lactamase superfamily hydrolase
LAAVAVRTRSKKSDNAKVRVRLARRISGLLNHAVFAEPDHKAAKELLARTYDQICYMAEAASRTGTLGRSCRPIGRSRHAADQRHNVRGCEHAHERLFA